MFPVVPSLARFFFSSSLCHAFILGLSSPHRELKLFYLAQVVRICSSVHFSGPPFLCAVGHQEVPNFDGRSFLPGTFKVGSPSGTETATVQHFASYIFSISAWGCWGAGVCPSCQVGSLSQVHIDNCPFKHAPTPTGNSEMPVNLMCMSLNCRKKPLSLDRSHTIGGRSRKLHPERYWAASQVIKPRILSCEAAVPLVVFIFKSANPTHSKVVPVWVNHSEQSKCLVYK